MTKTKTIYRITFTALVIDKELCQCMFNFIEMENKLKMHQPCLLDYGYGYLTAVKTDWSSGYISNIYLKYLKWITIRSNTSTWIKDPSHYNWLIIALQSCMITHVLRARILSQHSWIHVFNSIIFCIIPCRSSCILDALMNILIQFHHHALHHAGMTDLPPWWHWISTIAWVARTMSLRFWYLS